MAKWNQRNIKEAIPITRRYDSSDAKRRILSACVKLFIEKGYRQTRMIDIIHEADVSVSTFQNIFRSKDGVLPDLVDSMFDDHYETARKAAPENASSALLFAIEAAIQLALTELNENIREIYIEAYSYPQSADCIYRKTAYMLHELLGCYQPECDLSDFYETEIGTSGVMRNYIARPCDDYFTLRHKINGFLKICLRAYRVPEREISSICEFVASLDIIQISENAMNALFERLSVRFSLHLS